MVSKMTIDTADGSREIMKPYTRGAEGRWGRMRRWALLGLFFFFCWFWGLAFAFLAPYLILFFAFPIGILLFLCVWALPDEMPAPLTALNTMFFAYLVGKILWPDYLAIALPGLPWITIARLTGGPVALLLLICVSVSRPFRAESAAVLRQSTTIFYLMLAFNTLQVLTLPLSQYLAVSVDHLYNDEVSWIVMFFVASWVFSKPKRAERWVLIFWLLTIPTCIIGGLEFIKQRPLWAGHIPGFLKVEDPSVQMVLAGVMRAYTGRYRVISTATTPLGFSEYLALAAPFMIHTIMSSNYSRLLRWTAGLALPLAAIGVWLTNARLGSISLFLGLLIYGLLWALHQRRWRPRNIFASLITYAYPLLFLGAMAVTLLVGRIRRIVWGGGEAANSDAGRSAQFKAAVPLLEKNPIGHGVAMGGQTLGFRAPSGVLTIDSYFLSIILEYGVIGFLIYYGMFGLGAGRALRVAMRTPPERRELTLLMPIGVSLIIFIFIKAVFAEELNNGFGFMLLAMSCALIYRARVEAGEAAPSSAEPAVTSPLGGRGGHGPDQPGGLQLGGPLRPRRPSSQPATP